MIDKLVISFDKIFNIFLTVIFILIICLGCYTIYDLYKVNNSAQLSDDIINLRPKEQTTEYSLEELKKINKDIVAWIRINNTNIDYPIVIGIDNSEYLDKNYKKEFSTSGSIFLDYRNNRDFKDDYSIIYGHNMELDAMFSDIKKFENPDFFKGHKTGVLYTADNVYKIKIITLSKVSAYENSVFNVMSYSNNKNNLIFDFFDKHYIFKNKEVLNKNDKLLLLSTCTETGPNEREVLFVKMTKVDKNSNMKFDSSKLDNSAGDNRNLRKFLPKEMKNIELSARTIILIILTIIVIIIFLIALIQKIHYWKDK